MEMWFKKGRLFKKNAKETTEFRYKTYYITIKRDPQNKAFRVVFCNRNGKEAYYNDLLYPDLPVCISSARYIAFREDIRFKMPESGV